MSDRIAVFNEGKIQQVGTPPEIYERPASAFVAGFVGTSNLVHGEVARRMTGSEEMFSIRPEKIHLDSEHSEPAKDMLCIDGIVRDVMYLGLFTRYLVENLLPGTYFFTASAVSSTGSESALSAPGTKTIM